MAGWIVTFESDAAHLAIDGVDSHRFVSSLEAAHRLANTMRRNEAVKVFKVVEVEHYAHARLPG